MDSSHSSSPPPSVSPSAPSFTVDTSNPDAMSRIQVKPRPVITRSRLGCAACRKRKKACDLGKPVCGACERLSLSCEWPVIQIQSSSTPKSPTNLRARKRSRTSSTAEPNITPSPVFPNISNLAPNNQLQQQISYQQYPRYPTFTATPEESIQATLPPMYPMTTHHQTQISPQTPAVWRDNRLSNDMTGLGLDWTDILSGDSALDEPLIELLAAGCFASFGSHPDDLVPTHFSSTNIQLPSTTSILPSSHPPSSTLTSRTANIDSILSYYSKSLTSLVSCTGTDSPSGFDSFTQLASPSEDRGEPARALHIAILAWAGRHLVNKGNFRFESVSETYGLQAMALMESMLSKRGKPPFQPETETEQITMLAGCLMMMQYKICRGDVWGYKMLVDHLRHLGRSLFTDNPPKSVVGSMHFHFFENLLYHDVLSTFILRDAPIIEYSVLSAYGRLVPSLVNTLTGLSLPLFAIMHRIAAMIRCRLEVTAGEGPSGGGWSDDGLLDITRSAETVEEDLRAEKRHMEDLVRAQPHLSPHRYLHEAYRISCLLQLRSGVLCQRPHALSIKILVRQALSLLETMGEEHLPGRCSAHWVLFCAGLCATGDGNEPGKSNDRQRVRKLYADFGKDMAFANIQRSLKVVEEVWRRYEDGGAWVDWLDVVSDFDWELFVV